MSEQKENSRTVVLPKVRLSYPHLVTPRAATPGADPKYSAAIMVDKKDKAALAAVSAAVKAAIADGVERKWDGRKPPGLAIPLRDGDEEDDGVRLRGEEYRDQYYFNASSRARPTVLYGRLKQPAQPEDIWPGEYAAVSVTFFPYAVAGKRGVGVALNHVLLHGTGDRLDGATSAEEAFSSIDTSGMVESRDAVRSGGDPWAANAGGGGDDYDDDIPF